MKTSTLFGILFGLIAIFGAFIWEGGAVSSLFLLPPMIIVFGGTLAAGFSGTSFHRMLQLPNLLRMAIFPPKYDMEKLINHVVHFSTITRRDGILAVESYLEEVEHPFLKKMFEIALEGADPDTLHQIVETEISYITHRHNANIELFFKLGGYSPTMGIIGTVMGLISTLASAGNEPTVLIRHIASAFIATMWGIVMANVFWLPVGDKLRSLHNEEIYLLEVLLTGVIGVQHNETPTVLRSRLISAFPLSQQEDVLERSKEFERMKDKERKMPDVKIKPKMPALKDMHVPPKFKEIDMEPKPKVKDVNSEGGAIF